MEGTTLMITFDDIGCDFGERLAVECANGLRFSGNLVDFEADFDGSLGGDSISLRTDEGFLATFSEHEIKRIVQLGSATDSAESSDSN